MAAIAKRSSRSAPCHCHALIVTGTPGIAPRVADIHEDEEAAAVQIDRSVETERKRQAEPPASATAAESVLMMVKMLLLAAAAGNVTSIVGAKRS